MSNIILNLGVSLHHHVDKLVEVDGTVGICINIAHHVAQLLFGWIEAMCSHYLKLQNISISFLDEKKPDSTKSNDLKSLNFEG